MSCRRSRSFSVGRACSTYPSTKKAWPPFSIVTRDAMRSKRHAPGRGNTASDIRSLPNEERSDEVTMKRIALLLLLAASAFAEMPRPSFHTQGMPTGKPTGALKPGEYWWKPEISPSGPIIALVSIPQQTMNVYRNGILIARTSVSTGTKGRGTPSGVFTILEKEERHYSKKYHNAPMPNMQRLTWSGIAMHSGN